MIVSPVPVPSTDSSCSNPKESIASMNSAASFALLDKIKSDVDLNTLASLMNSISGITGYAVAPYIVIRNQVDAWDLKIHTRN